MNSRDRALVYRLIDQTKTRVLAWRRTQETPVERFEATAVPLKFTLTGGDRSENEFLPFILSVLNTETDHLTSKVTEPPAGAGLLLNLFREVAGTLKSEIDEAFTPVEEGNVSEPAEVSEVLTTLAVKGAESPVGTDISPDKIAAIDHLSMQQIDELPYGVMHLDRDGRVLFYNVNESQRSGLAREDVEGKNFFTEIAPCTKVQQFYGRFQDLVSGQAKRLVETFNFTFRFPDGDQNVVIVMSHNRRTDGVRVLVLGRSVTTG